MTVPDMSAEQGTAAAAPVLRRMTRKGQAEHTARATSLAKALRLTLAKVADARLNLPLAALAIRTHRQEGSDLQEVLPKDHLLLLLDGPQGRRGAALLDPALVGA